MDTYLFGIDKQESPDGSWFLICAGCMADTWFNYEPTSDDVRAFADDHMDCQ